MDTSVISEKTVQEAINHHGHSCPGLAIGIRAVEMAAAEFGIIPDELFMAIAETDKCATDGIQFLTGCTFENGRLSLEDKGKNVFSFFRPGDKKGKRVSQKPVLFIDGDDRLMELRKKMAKEKLSEEEDQLLKKLMSIQVKQVMDADLDSLFIVEDVDCK